jgi:DNA-binding transcriptional regulator YhcF (GntR family)
MDSRFDNDRPIYLQVKEAVEEAILAGEFQPGQAIPSNSQLVELFRITPVTVQRASDLLVAEGLVQKRRGVGMFVCDDALERIQRAYREGFDAEYVKPLLHRAGQLGISLGELETMLERQMGEEQKGEGRTGAPSPGHGSKEHE